MSRPSTAQAQSCRVIAVANQKGGVGKTTTTVNLSACLADIGQRVLVIDLDPQANATTGLGVDPYAGGVSTYDVLLQNGSMKDSLVATQIDNLWVSPSTLDLAGAEIELVPAFSRERRLESAVAEVSGDFDYVFVDCPPSLGLLTVNALAAAREVMVPIQCEYYALEGLGQLMRNIDLVRNGLNSELEISLIVLVMYDGRTKLSAQVASEIRSYFGDKVCRQMIPRNVRLAEAPSHGAPITVTYPNSRGALAYRELAKEVVDGALARAG